MPSDLSSSWVPIGNSITCPNIANTSTTQIIGVNFSAPGFGPMSINSTLNCISWQLHSQPTSCSGTWANGATAAQQQEIFQTGMGVFECTSVMDGANVTTCQLLMTTQTVSSCQAVCAG